MSPDSSEPCWWDQPLIQAFLKKLEPADLPYLADVLEQAGHASQLRAVRLLETTSWWPTFCLEITSGEGWYRLQECSLPSLLKTMVSDRGRVVTWYYNLASAFIKLVDSLVTLEDPQMVLQFMSDKEDLHWLHTAYVLQGRQAEADAVTRLLASDWWPNCVITDLGNVVWAAWIRGTEPGDASDTTADDGSNQRCLGQLTFFPGAGSAVEAKIRAMLPSKRVLTR